MKKGERLSILMFVLIFALAVFEFIYLPDGMGLRLVKGGLKHYYRIKPYEILLPVAIGSLGAGLTHHGTMKKGIGIFLVAMLIFLGTIWYQI